MREVKLSTVKEVDHFWIDPKSATEYKIDRKEKGQVICTSIKSRRTFYFPANKKVWILN